MPATPEEIAEKAVSSVEDGEIDPLKAYAFMMRFQRAAEIFRNASPVVDAAFSELAKYEKNTATMDGVRLEQTEAGVKYDYSGCGDSELARLSAEMEDLKARIKDRERVLRALPPSGMADPETGEIVFPPARSSKTIIKVTFTK